MISTILIAVGIILIAYQIIGIIIIGAVASKSKRLTSIKINLTPALLGVILLVVGLIL